VQSIFLIECMYVNVTPSVLGLCLAWQISSQDATSTLSEQRAPVLGSCTPPCVRYPDDLRPNAFSIYSHNCAVVFSVQVLVKCTNLELTFIYILILSGNTQPEQIRMQKVDASA